MNFELYLMMLYEWVHWWFWFEGTREWELEKWRGSLARVQTATELLARSGDGSARATDDFHRKGNQLLITQSLHEHVPHRNEGSFLKLPVETLLGHGWNLKGVRLSLSLADSDGGGTVAWPPPHRTQNRRRKQKNRKKKANGRKWKRVKGAYLKMYQHDFNPL